MVGRILTMTLLLSLIWSGATADYRISGSTFSEAGGVISNDSYTILQSIGQVSPVATSSSARFHLVSGVLPAVSDLEPPTIRHTIVASANLRDSIEVIAYVTDNSGLVEEVTLHFHEGGLTTFRRRVMQILDDSTYIGNIPPSAVTERGLVYYIEAKDRTGNTSTFPSDAPDSIINVTVSFSDLQCPFNLPASQYRMISVPGVPSNGDPDSVLVDDLGTYDRKRWRLGRWSRTEGDTCEYCYDEYPDIVDFAPGKAFWLILRNTKSFDFTGSSVDVSQPFRLRLERGWNQIATPFAFSIDWLSGSIMIDTLSIEIGEEVVVGEDTILVEDNLIAYTGDYVPFQSMLVPWRGYWVYNASTCEVDMSFPPVMAKSPIVNSHDKDNQRLTFTVSITSEDGAHSRCFACVDRLARKTYDRYDLHLPPPIGKQPRIFFERSHWGRNSGLYFVDSQPFSPEGTSWEIAVESDVLKSLALDVTAPATVPSDWDVAIFELIDSTLVGRINLPYEFSLCGRRNFLLAAGAQEYIQSLEEKVTTTTFPRLVVTPNPFTDIIGIKFGIDHKQEIRLQIFDVRGSLVKTIFTGKVGAQMHSFIWDGTFENGKPVAPGIYFIVLSGEAGLQVGKIVKLR